MTILTEGMHTGEYLLEELPGHASRENIIVAAGENLQPGTVIGFTTALPSPVAGSANVGNGTAAVTAIGAGARVGSYAAVATSPTTFKVTAPDAADLGVATAGVAFTGGGITFTITAGATPFAAGDTFTFPVARGNAKAWAPGASDGSQTVGGIVYARTDATAGPKRAVAHVRISEVN